jgi:RNA polymerase sigma-70 factor (ECF subfamily)
MTENNEKIHRERDLVRQAREGDTGAFGELVNMHNERVYAVAFGMVHHADDARELTQQIWIKAWNKLGTYKGDARFFTWLYRVAVFTCLDFLRKKQRAAEVRYLDEMAPDSDSDFNPPSSIQARPDRHAQRAEIKLRFEEALKALPAKHRAALVLREVEGLSYEEIARFMNCRKCTVMSRIHYARKSIRENMRDLL